MKLNDANKIYVGATLVSAVYAGASKAWPTAISYGADERLYPVAQPAPAAPSDPNTFTAGVRVKILADGRITGLRRWRHSGSVNTCYVGLWSDVGVLLASGTTVNDAIGWNTFTLPTPVLVTANQIIRVAYGYGGTPTGAFAYSNTAFTSGSANLLYQNGVYSTAVASGGQDDYPSNTIAANHYYADIVYQKRLP